VSAVHLMCLSVVLEVYQFARDAAVAEAWLIAHEPYLTSQEYGVCYLSSVVDMPLLQSVSCGRYKH